MKATAQAHPNIALVKYWGKRDPVLNLPGAGSLSLTLAGLNTVTTVTLGGGSADTLVLDGVKASDAALAKALRVVDPIRRQAGLASACVSIESHNDFPTGAGLASSASGLAALTVATAGAAGLQLLASELSRIARVGSGSACRSILGGFAEWQPGQQADGSDSFAVSLHGPEHWDLRVVVAVVAREPKAVGSTAGMTHTRETSPFHEPYLSSVPEDLEVAREAIAARDFEALSGVAEHSCLKMHAAMMGAKPPLIYLRPTTWEVIGAVRELRDAGTPAFFTVDAGPNVKVFCPVESVEAVRRRLIRMPCVTQLIAARPGSGARLVDGGAGA